MRQPLNHGKNISTPDSIPPGNEIQQWSTIQ